MFQIFLQNLEHNIQTILIQALSLDASFTVKLEKPKDKAHGDYALNSAMKLSKQLSQNPREIAATIVEHIQTIDSIQKVEIAGPGFINIFLKNEIYLQHFLEIYSQDLYLQPLADKSDQTILVEYPSPNVAKPLAIHHLLSTIIGQTFYNITKKEGYKTISISHNGDWGTQFGKIIYAYKHFNHTINLETADVMDLLDLYVEFCKQEEKDSIVADGAREEFRKIELQDEENMKLWQKCIEISQIDVDRVLGYLGGIHIEKVIGESFYSEMMEPIVEDGIKKEIFTDSDGTLVCHFPEEKFPTVPIKKKDGGTLYITRDLATVQYRVKTWKPTEVIYVVDVAQKLHFQQVFEISKMLGADTNGFHHVGFGRMSFKDGTKMSTRKGTVLLLENVIDESIKRAARIIQNLQPHIEKKQLEYLSSICGKGALKYNILSQNIHTNFAFDWDSMLALEGNSAPYLQYTHARAKSIIKKSEVRDQRSESLEITNPLLPLEKYIIQKILQFPETIQRVHSEYKTNILCNYLFEMTQDYNAMYGKHSVLNAESEEKKSLRLVITQLFADTLKEGLSLLGIESPEVM